ncbi:MAG TPA: C-GCAxxG-C-C family (seleno)protein [Candidatus Izemoplasmatales bacterium]|nr:C-GCAxxG-C-C family (seleno)protein [Candidatus Izemoplasmatales bacterium]
MTSRDFRLSHKNLNCSETMLHYGNDIFNLNLSDTALESMAGFGGGLFENDLCGVVSGGVAIISMVLTKQSPNLKPAVIEFKKHINDAFGDIQCSKIRPIHRQHKLGCQSLIIQSMDIMVDLVKTYQKI